MTISEVSKSYNVAPSTLRYYESIGLLPHIRRTDGGVRSYTEEDCKRLEVILFMKRLNIPLEPVKEYISHRGADEKEERKNLLVGYRQNLIERINDMQASLSMINSCIENFDEFDRVAYSM